MIRWSILPASILGFFLPPAAPSPEMRVMAAEYHRVLVRLRETQTRLAIAEANRDSHAALVGSVRMLLIDYFARTAFPSGPVSGERWSSVVDSALTACGYEPTSWGEAVVALRRANVSTADLGDGPSGRDTEPGPARVPGWEWDGE